jgi:hypothetical protein
MMGLLYMMANLDQSNLGNANIAGMPEDIGLTGNQFDIAATLLYGYLALHCDNALTVYSFACFGEFHS